jgi:iron complex outermembrane receptor protein
MMKSILLLLLFCNALANSQVSDTTAVLGEVVIARYRISDSLLRTPAGIGVLTSRDLQRNNNSDMAPLLNMLPGVFMQSGSINTNRISIRGIGARTPYGTNKIRAFYGAIPLTSGDSETTIEDIDPEVIGQLEVVRGPMSSAYGAGLGGAILITPRSSTIPGSRASVSATYGSFGLAKNTINYGLSGKSSSLNLNYHRLESTGYRENSRYFREGVTLAGDVLRTDKGKLTYFGSYTYLMAYIASSIDRTTFENNPKAAASTWKAAKGYEQYHNWYGGLAYEWAITSWITNATSVFASSKNSYEPRPFDILFQNTKGYGGRTQFNSNFKFVGISMQALAGAEFFSDGFTGGTAENLYQQNNGQGSLEGAQLTGIEQRRHFLNAFAQLRIPLLRKLEVQAGINYNTTSFKLENTYPSGNNYNGSYNYGGIWAPQAALLFKPTELQMIYISASRGFSIPSIEETLTPEGTINTGIKPENGYSLEAGAKAWFFNRALYIEASLYHMAIRDLLVAQRVGDDRYVGLNAGKTLHEGIELVINYRWEISKAIMVQPYINASVGRYGFREFNTNSIDYSGNRLTGVPANKITGGITLTAGNAYLNADYYFVDKLPVNDANTIYADAYNLLNLKAGYRLRLTSALAAHAAIGVNNSTNTQYSSMVLVNATAVGNNQPRFYYPGQPVNYYGNISLQYLF